MTKYIMTSLSFYREFVRASVRCGVCSHYEGVRLLFNAGFRGADLNP